MLFFCWFDSWEKLLQFEFKYNKILKQENDSKMACWKWRPIRPGLYVCDATLSYIQGTPTVKTTNLHVTEGGGLGGRLFWLSITLTKANNAK